MDHTLDLMVCILLFLRCLWLSLWGQTLFWQRLWSTLWIGYYSGRKISAIQLYLADLHWQRRIETFYSPLKLETVKCYLYVEDWFGERTLCSDYVLYPEEGRTDTLCESLRSWEVSQRMTNELVIHVWMRTSLVWELLEVFRWFWNSPSEIEFCRLLAAGIVSTNLYLKNLRFVNWKPGIEFTSWDIGSKDWCQKFI